MGNLLKTTTPVNLLENSYDELNRVTQKQDALGTLASFSYDANNNLSTETDARGFTSVHTYNALNQKIQSQLPGDRVAMGSGLTFDTM